jgi:hypothetical protein
MALIAFSLLNSTSRGELYVLKICRELILEVEIISLKINPEEVLISLNMLIIDRH